MGKAVMLSIRPKWCEKIISGEKTIEVRKNRPKLETPFKAYIYCTTGRPDLNIPISQERLMQDYLNTGSMKSLNCPHGNGKVIGEFTCDRIYGLAPLNHAPDDVEQQACLTREEIARYLNGVGYGWHISNLKIYDTPKELIEFHTWKKCKSCSKSGYESTACIYDENCMVPVAITKAPQSWCYVEAME
jgi:predicted transcriptional regulator